MINQLLLLSGVANECPRIIQKYLAQAKMELQN